MHDSMTPLYPSRRVLFFFPQALAKFLAFLLARILGLFPTLSVIALARELAMALRRSCACAMSHPAKFGTTFV